GDQAAVYKQDVTAYADSLAKVEDYDQLNHDDKPTLQPVTFGWINQSYKNALRQDQAVTKYLNHIDSALTHSGDDTFHVNLRQINTTLDATTLPKGKQSSTQNLINRVLAANEDHDMVALKTALSEWIDTIIKHMSTAAGEAEKLETNSYNALIRSF